MVLLSVLICVSLCQASAASSASLRGGLKLPAGISPPDPHPLEQAPGERQRLSRELDRIEDRLEKSRQRSRKLQRLTTDDGPEDTFVWQNLSAFAKDDSDSSFWRSMCNAINRSNSSNESSIKARPFDEWKVSNGTSCDALTGDFNSEAAAAAACKGKCGGVLDYGCKRQSFRLCALGAIESPSKSGSCIRRRVPGLAGGAPGPPRDLAFWKRFCARWTESVKFRLLFAGRVCANAKTLAEAPTEARCAELAAQDSECSKVFDFQEGLQTKCRCVPKSAQCEAAGPEMPLNLTRNVYLLD